MHAYHVDSSHYSCILGFTSTSLFVGSVLPKDTPTNNPEDPVRLEPRTFGFRVKHFTSEPRRIHVGERGRAYIPDAENVIEATLNIPNSDRIYRISRRESRSDCSSMQSVLGF